MRPSEIRRGDKPGVKGISKPFVSRILFGTTFEEPDPGVVPSQATSRLAALPASTQSSRSVQNESD